MTSYTPGMPLVVVGDGATLQVGSDRYPYTVIEVRPGGKFITVQQDKFTRTDDNGQSESQTYATESNPSAQREDYSWRKNRQAYVRVGVRQWDGSALSVGERHPYQDPSF